MIAPLVSGTAYPALVDGKGIDAGEIGHKCGMAIRRRTGATAAAALPAALAGALLVGAPFAGTTTAPLANSHTRAYVASTTHSAGGNGADRGLSVSISPGSMAVLGTAEVMLLGVGVGVMAVARRRHDADD